MRRPLASHLKDNPYDDNSDSINGADGNANRKTP